MSLVSRMPVTHVLAGVFLSISLTICAFAQERTFLDFVKLRLKEESGLKEYGANDFDKFCSIGTSPLAERVLSEYGSIFAAAQNIRLPQKCIFETPAEVAQFQARLKIRASRFGNVEIELQDEAMAQLLRAVEEASLARLSITPLDGRVAGRRSYDDTVRIWNSRLHRALDHWTRRGRIGAEKAEEVRLSAVRDQAEQVMKWESEGLYFSTNLTKSIFFSVAPPGTSQHLSMLAFDVVEAGNPAVRRILNKYGWFQTIRTDQPHFTFLGLPESELPRRGLRNVIVRGNSYWVPLIEPTRTNAAGSQI